MFTLVKRNKRLWIEQDGVAIYTPPDFIRHRMQSRNALVYVVQRLNSGVAYIRAVMDFESDPGLRMGRRLLADHASRAG